MKYVQKKKIRECINECKPYEEDNIDNAYEIFSQLSENQYRGLMRTCKCDRCEDKNDEDGIYPHCSHFSTCATDIIMRHL